MSRTAREKHCKNPPITYDMTPGREREAFGYLIVTTFSGSISLRWQEVRMSNWDQEWEEIQDSSVGRAVAHVWLWSNLTNWCRGFESHPGSQFFILCILLPANPWCLRSIMGQAHGHQLDVWCQDLPERNTAKIHQLLMIWHLAGKEKPLAIYMSIIILLPILTRT